MKTIKIFIIIIMTLFVTQQSKSYLITIRNICQSPDNPTPFYFPSGLINIDFKIDSVSNYDRGDPRCKIYLSQNGIDVLMFNGIVPEGENHSVPLNPESFPGLNYNEPFTIKFKVNSIVYPVFYSTRDAYAIIYKEGLSGKYGSIGNGSAELLINNQFATFFSSYDCESVSTANYLTKQYKITFTLHGDFTDSVPEVIPRYSLGYSGSLPSDQNRWAYVLSHNNSEIKFITFVYNLSNILGQSIGYVPCNQQEARVVYKYVSRPEIISISQFPPELTPSNGFGIITANTNGYYDSTFWKDSNNIHNHVLTPLEDYALIRSGFSNQDNNSEIYRSINNDNSRLEWYSVHSQKHNRYFSSPWYKYRVLFGSDPTGCPGIYYNFAGNDILENHILPLSLSSPGKDVTDYFQTVYPFNKDNDSIIFKIREKNIHKTKIDQLEMFVVKADKNTEVSITQQGEVVNFINDPLKNEIYLNNLRDVTEELKYQDNNVVSLEKDTILNITTPNDGSGYIVIKGKTTREKDKVSAIITTNLDEQINVHLRELTGTVCIKFDKKGFDALQIRALQNCNFDRIAIVQNLTELIPEKLDLLHAANNFGDMRKTVSFKDNYYMHISNGNDANFIFKNNKNPDKQSFYFIKFVGEYFIPDYEESDAAKNKELNNYEFRLSGNFPNPFNPVTKFSFEIPKSGNVKLTVYDVSGKQVKILLDDYRIAGKYDVLFNGSDLGSGMYFYKLETGNFKKSGKMLLIK